MMMMAMVTYAVATPHTSTTVNEKRKENELTTLPEAAAPESVDRKMRRNENFMNEMNRLYAQPLLQLQNYSYSSESLVSLLTRSLSRPHSGLQPAAATRSILHFPFSPLVQLLREPGSGNKLGF